MIEFCDVLGSVGTPRSIPRLREIAASNAESRRAAIAAIQSIRTRMGIEGGALSLAAVEGGELSVVADAGGLSVPEPN